MLRQLADQGPICACDLDGGRAISQPTVSHHLKVLREAGWIVGERRGTWIWYSLRPEAATRFRHLAATFEAPAPARDRPRRRVCVSPSAVRDPPGLIRSWVEPTGRSHLTGEDIAVGIPAAPERDTAIWDDSTVVATIRCGRDQRPRGRGRTCSESSWNGRGRAIMTPSPRSQAPRSAGFTLPRDSSFEIPTGPRTPSRRRSSDAGGTAHLA